MKIIYLDQAGETTGPFTVAEVRAHLASGSITTETPACT